MTLAGDLRVFLLDHLDDPRARPLLARLPVPAVDAIAERNAALRALAGHFSGSISSQVATLQRLLRRYGATRWRSDRFRDAPQGGDPIYILLFQVFHAGGGEPPLSRSRLYEILSDHHDRNRTKAA